MIACAGFVKPMGSRLGLIKSTFNAENFNFAGRPDLS